MFDPIRIYDKPAVILTQLGNGIATTDSVRRAMFDPGALSPIERQSYVDEFKKSVGGGGVTDTIIDVISNPLSWAAFIAGGAMSTKNFAKTGRFFTGGLETAGFGEWAKSKWPLLRSMRLLSASQELQGTALPAILEAVPSQMKRLQNKFSVHVNDGVREALDKLSAKHGVKITTLHPGSAPNAAVEEDLKRIRATLHAKFSGYDKDVSFKYIVGMKPGAHEILTRWTDAKGKEHSEWINVGTQREFNKYEEGIASGKGNYIKIVTDKDGLPTIGDMMSADTHSTTTLADRNNGTYRSFQIVDPKTGVRGDSVLHSGPQIDIENIERGAVIGDIGKLDRNIKEFGLEKLVRGVDAMRADIRMELYGDESHYAKTGQFQVDREKVLRIARGAIGELKNQKIIGKDGRLNFTEATTVNGMLSEEVAGVITQYAKDNPGRGANAQDLESLMVRAYEHLVEDPNYLPRNTSAVYKNSGGVKVEVEPSPFSQPGSFAEASGRELTPSGRTKFRVRASPPMDPDDIRLLIDEFGGTPDLHKMLADATANITAQQQKDVRGHYKVHQMAPDEALQKYIVSASRDAVMFSQDPMKNPSIVAALQDFRGPATNMMYPAPTGEKVGLSGSKKPHLAPEGLKPAGGYSLSDIVNTHMSTIEEHVGADAYIPKAMREHVLPSVFGYRTIEDGASRALSEWTRGKALSVSNSDFFKAVEKQGGISERFVRGMRQYGKSAPSSNNDFGTGIAKMFYGSTMGLNMQTALTNLLQPLQNLHHLGFKNTVRAYSQSISQMAEYARQRNRLGPNASPVEIEAAMDRAMSRNLAGNVNVKLREVADIGGAWDSVERSGYGSHLTNPTGGIFEIVMKPFQITEMTNRLVTANSVLNSAEAGWRAGGRKNVHDPYRAIQDARQAVEMMQFGSSPMNRPMLFYKDFLRNPAIRQFMQFPVRTAVNIAAMPAMVGGSRTVFGKEVTSKYGVMGVDTLRMLGVSAIAYEVGKNMLGADISRGLSVGFIPDIDIDRDKSLQLPVPPFADAMYSGIRGVLSGGDVEVMSSVVPLIIPGGVALSRALGAAPQSDLLQTVGLQKRFADWSSPDEQGNVPVFDQDSRMLGMYSGSDIVLRAMGTDLGRFQNQGEVTQFLLKNRDEMRDERRQWIAAVLSNNMQQAGKIKANYERQFGMPLTVTQQQMQQAVKVREQSVSSRTLDSMDKDLQSQYQDIMSQSVPAAMTSYKMPIEQNAQYVWSNLPKR